MPVYRQDLGTGPNAPNDPTDNSVTNAPKRPDYVRIAGSVALEIQPSSTLRGMMRGLAIYYGQS